MKSFKEYIVNEAHAPNSINKETKEEIRKFVDEYFDKFNNNPKNFLKHKFEKKSNYLFSWSIESLLNSPDVPHKQSCTNLLVSIRKKEFHGKIMPDYWSGHQIYMSYMHPKVRRNVLIKRYLGAYKTRLISKREKDPALIYQYCLRDYNYIANFNTNLKILEDPGFLELYDFTDSKNYEYIDSDGGVTIKVFLWNKFWPIIRFDFEDIDEGLKIKSSTNVSKDINDHKFIICMPGNFIKLNSEQ